jgi:hypothetical protein
MSLALSSSYLGGVNFRANSIPANDGAPFNGTRQNRRAQFVKNETRLAIAG